MDLYTKTLFYDDVDIRHFVATVIDCYAVQGSFKLVLDKTAFYPEGGGQPADRGKINNVQVMDVQIEDGKIVHITDTFFNKGEIVEGEIDWDFRFSLMQNHTGEHILSGLIKDLFGYDNVGFHMGQHFTTIDINGELGESELINIERLANHAIYKNLEVDLKVFDKGGANTIEYRSKKELGCKIRIVSVPGYDSCACCGLHCKTTGQIGIIKILNHQKYKGGTRLFILCGQSALEDIVVKNKNAYEISALLSAKPNEIALSVSQMLNENAMLKQKLASSRKELLHLKAKQLPQKAGKICVFENGLNSRELSQYCLCLCERAEVEVVAILTEIGDGKYKYAIGGKNENAQNVAAELKKQFAVNGGGKSPLFQGTVTASSASIISFLKQLNFTTQFSHQKNGENSIEPRESDR